MQVKKKEEKKKGRKGKPAKIRSRENLLKKNYRRFKFVFSLCSCGVYNFKRYEVCSQCKAPLIKQEVV